MPQIRGRGWKGKNWKSKAQILDWWTTKEYRISKLKVRKYLQGQLKTSEK